MVLASVRSWWICEMGGYRNVVNFLYSSAEWYLGALKVKVSDVKIFDFCVIFLFYNRITLNVAYSKAF
jgi:hypothetical protein